jgi:hypothetical protein
MKNSKSFFSRRPHTLMVMITMIVMFYFPATQAHAGMPDKQMSFSQKQLTEFEGYYQFDNDKNRYLQIMVKNDKLVLKQLWDDREIVFEQKSPLNFYNEQFSFPLSFSKGTNGEITQVLAFERDTWTKVKDYKPVERKEIKLSAEKMQAYAGKYRITNEGNEAFLEFTVNGNALEVKEVWSGKTYTIVPESELVFFAKKAYYPVQFTKDKDGNVTQALIFNRDVWVKVKG